MDDLYYCISSLLAEYIIENKESAYITKIIKNNYFYFSNEENVLIKKICLGLIKKDNLVLEYKKEVLQELLEIYLREKKIVYFEGVCNFRIKKYFEILEYLVEISVQSYIKLKMN